MAPEVDTWIRCAASQQNVLLDGRGGVKLADFGMARPVRNGLSAYSPGVVTLWYVRLRSLPVGAVYLCVCACVRVCVCLSVCVRA
jgi:hypothetical protein